MSHRYVLLSAADADLREIVNYTHNQWGKTQASIYMAKLKACVEQLVDGQVASRDMSALYPDLRMARCEHHYIFFLPRDSDPTLIVAIFHERMDLMTRLADRLK